MRQTNKRRQFTVEYKRAILAESDACTAPGQIGALLRREGLYASNLSGWRRARARAETEALTPKKRGRKPKRIDPRDDRIAELERELEGERVLRARADHTIAVQKIKIAKLSGRQSMY